MDFPQMVSGVPLVLVVIGLVEWLKRFGVAGKLLNGASLAVGLALGIAYQYAQGAPVDFAGWFAAGVFGIGLGLVASGIYDAGASVVAKIADRV